MAKPKIGRRSVLAGKAPPSLADELTASLGGEIRRCAMRAAEQAEVLESIGAHSFDLTCDIFPDCTAMDLSRRAHAIRGLVAHALGVIADLRGVAGALEALAALRLAESAAAPEHEAVRRSRPR